MRSEDNDYSHTADDSDHNDETVMEETKLKTPEPASYSSDIYNDADTDEDDDASAWRWKRPY